MSVMMSFRETPIEVSIRELRSVAQRLRLMGPTILLITVANLGLLLWGLTDARSPYGGYGESLAITNILISMATIGALGFFESLRKRGDAIFQEVSDELQWHVGRTEGRGTQSLEGPTTRPMLEARVTLRTFSAAAELPLVPGPMGGAVYAVLNLFIAVAAAALLGN